MKPSILFVTGNKHKLEEASVILAPYGICVGMAGCEKLEIQADKLEDVASYAARLAAKSVKSAVVVEDSGLFIDALQGFPGPFSSYAFKTIGLSGILRLMRGIRSRGASFMSAVAYCEPGNEPEVFTGVSKGAILRSPKGSRGFGFDPIFAGEGSGLSFAELSNDEKCKVSHRGEAFRHFSEWFLGKRL